MEGVTDAGFVISGNQYEYIEYGAAMTSDGFEKTISGLVSGTVYYSYAFFTLDESYKRTKRYTVDAFNGLNDSIKN